jgi:hypothetical protein
VTRANSATRLYLLQTLANISQSIPSEAFVTESQVIQWLSTLARLAEVPEEITIESNINLIYQLHSYLSMLSQLSASKFTLDSLKNEQIDVFELLDNSQQAFLLQIDQWQRVMFALAGDELNLQSQQDVAYLTYIQMISQVNDLLQRMILRDLPTDSSVLPLYLSNNIRKTVFESRTITSTTASRLAVADNGFYKTNIFRSQVANSTTASSTSPTSAKVSLASSLYTSNYIASPILYTNPSLSYENMTTYPIYVTASDSQRQCTYCRCVYPIG